MCFKFFFFSCTCCYKGNTNKKNLNCRTFSCLSLHCHHLNEDAVIGAQVKAIDQVNTLARDYGKGNARIALAQKKVTGELICFPELLAGLVVG